MKNFIRKTLVALFNRQDRSVYSYAEPKTESGSHTISIDQTAAVDKKNRRKKDNQMMIVLELLSYGPMSTIDALDKGITRPAAVIFELKKRGYKINTKMIDVVSRNGEVRRIASYILYWDGNGRFI
jgi:hypothetical protein